MTVQIAVSASPGERRYARIEDGRVAAIRVARGLGTPYVGAVYLGRVVRLEPGIGGAFVEIGLSQPGFLNLGKRKLSEGQPVTVRVKADPYGEKGARLAFDEMPAPDGAKPPLRLAPAADPLQELQIRGEACELIEAKPGQLSDPFESAGGAEALEEALHPLVRLPSGGRLMIERTTALWAIDVDTGAHKGPDAKFRANREAAFEVARQVRLRNLGGRILVDFAGLPRNRLKNILAALKEELARDELPVHLGGVTPLGLVELARERRTAALADLFTGPEALAYEGLRKCLAVVRSCPAARPRLAVPQEALDLLRGPLAPVLAEAESRLGHKLDLVSGPSLEVLEK